MIASSDKEYQLTKLIKQGKAAINSDFKQLANWIDASYDVQTLNIIYDTIDEGKTPRLEIIFEFIKDEEKFIESFPFDYNKEKELAIANQFKKSLQDQGLIKKDGFLGFLRKNEFKYRTDDLFVIYSAFERTAKEEVYGSVSTEQMQELKRQIANDEIWDIISGFATAIIFFYTDVQVQENSKNGVKEALSDRYFELLKPYDEFDYIKRDSFFVSLDSKENFDNKYQSNWYNYFH
ncbi:MAG: hypothetical protein ACXVB0_04970 [Mucilaginibacter sp.]